MTAGEASSPRQEAWQRQLGKLTQFVIDATITMLKQSSIIFRADITPLTLAGLSMQME